MQSLIVSIDFETAHGFKDIYHGEGYSSMCAMGIAVYDRVKEQTTTEYFEIKPEPFTMDQGAFRIHGILLGSLKDKPTFDEVYLDYLKPLLKNTGLLIAHNMEFDKRVLTNALKYYGYKIPEMNTLCTMEVCKSRYPNERYSLDAVARKFDIPLMHHNAKSDALACLNIYMKICQEINDEMKNAE